MSNDDPKIQKELLEDNIAKCLEFIKNKTEPKDAIKIYEEFLSVGRASLEKLGKLEELTNIGKYKCRKCGAVYDSHPIKNPQGAETIFCLECNSDQIDLMT